MRGRCGLPPYLKPVKQGVEDFMDKMTDAKIRMWLKNNSPDLLDAYNRYQAEKMGDFSLPGEEAPPAPEPLRVWMENRHPDVLGKIPLW
jgi:hypothetical protein